MANFKNSNNKSKSGGKKTNKNTNGKNTRGASGGSAAPHGVDLRILIPILILCAVIIAVIAVRSCENGGSDTTDTEMRSDPASSDENTTGEDTTQPGSSESTEPADDTTLPDEDDTAPGYSIETDVQTSKTDIGDISMQYPKIEPTDEDKVDSELINTLIRDYMDQKFKNEHIESGIIDIDTSYEYEITSTSVMLQTADFLSVVVKGNYYIKDTGHPTIFAYTLNCDLNSKELLDSETLIGDFDSIKAQFIDGKFTLIEGNDDLLEETNYSDMIIEYRSDYGIYPDVYYTKDSFGICIDLVYTLGGYALFEIPVENVADYAYVPSK